MKAHALSIIAALFIIGGLAFTTRSVQTASAQEAPPADASTSAGIVDAGATDAGSTEPDGLNDADDSSVDPDASDAADAAAQDASDVPCPPSAAVSPSAIEVAVQQVFNNARIPKDALEAMSCDQYAQVKDEIWGRHGFFFENQPKREAFAVAHKAMYVPLPHVNADTIGLYLTARDNLALMQLGRAAYDKGCHRRAAAP